VLFVFSDILFRLFVNKKTDVPKVRPQLLFCVVAPVN